VNPLTPLVRLVGRYQWLMRLAPAIVGGDRLLNRWTHGRITLVGLAGLPSLRLTTIGRRTGVTRANSLLYLPYQDGFVLVGSGWGRHEHPAWTANLIADPGATVNVRGRTIAVKARRLEGAELARVWQLCDEMWPGYRMERELAGREFRVFALEPV
jgi:deazaflavin-dependent oxidoreductase (nitroreductase family)